MPIWSFESKSILSHASDAFCLLFFFIRSPLSKVRFALSWRSPLQTKIVKLLGRDWRRHWLFMITWVFLLLGSHYDMSSFCVCFIWHNFIWGVSPSFQQIYLFQKQCINQWGPVEHFCLCGCGPVGNWNMLHDFWSFLQISVSFS